MNGERANPLVRLKNQLESLSLTQMRLGVGTSIDSMNSGSRNPVEALSDLVDAELRLRQEKVVSICVNTAHLQSAKTLEDFDFSFRPSLNRAEVMDSIT